MSEQVTIPGLPERLHDVATKLVNYGFQIRKKDGDFWVVTYPQGDPSGYTDVGLYESDLSIGLLRILRTEEQRRGILYRYEQFDAQWGSKVYGLKKDDTTIAAAGCGPTSLAIVLQYLMNNGSRQRNASYAVSPEQAAKYATTHGRVSGHGTAGDPMIRGISEKWPEFDGRKVTLAETIELLGKGELIIFLCKGCRGYTRNRPLHRDTNVSYGGHYMVLAGVEGSSDADRIYYVVDPGKNANHAMRFIKHRELMNHTAGFWWVCLIGDPTSRMSSNPG